MQKIGVTHKMKSKYWVPAIERAHEVLTCIAKQPSKLRMIDLVNETGINKSTMFSLLHTLETLDWVKREKGDTYSLGGTLAHLGNVYFASMDVVKLFMEHALDKVNRVGETMQLARLEGEHIVYLAKQEAPSPVRLLSEPGRRIPAYATALGKVLLACRSDEEVRERYQHQPFVPLTSRTVRQMDELILQLQQIRAQGYALDEEEVAAGFCCIAAPIRDTFGHEIAAVSFSIPIGHWADKRETAQSEIISFAQKLSSLL